jgi:Cdc6-like AAA superfamily ATPase
MLPGRPAMPARQSNSSRRLSGLPKKPLATWAKRDGHRQQQARSGQDHRAAQCPCHAAASRSSGVLPASHKRATKVSTGQTYEVYRDICVEQKARALTQRRFCDMIGFLDLYGLINARIVSLSRYGKTREIMSSLPDRVVKGLI